MLHPVRPLDHRQIAVFLVYGVVVWFLAALLLRWLGPLGIYQGGLRLLVYLLIIPGTLPLVWLSARLAGNAPGQLFPGFTLASAMAALCDGMALAWTPTLYGATTALHAGAGAMILWGLGVGIFLAYLWDRPARSG